MKKKATRDKKGKTRAVRGGKRSGRVPPAESELWPV
jgi:hypothetical protein